MKEQIEKRIVELNLEYETGAKKLEELHQQMVSIREIMTRISGGIIALEQILEEEGKSIKI